MDAASVVVGFYGKLPSHGDFVGRRMPETLLQSWDAWMQASLARSREGAASSWLDVYLTASMWRFVAAAGAFAQQKPNVLVMRATIGVARRGRSC